MRQRYLRSVPPLSQWKDEQFSLPLPAALLPNHCRKELRKPTVQPHDSCMIPVSPGPLCCNPLIRLSLPPWHTLQSPLLGLLLIVLLSSGQVTLPTGGLMDGQA